MESREQENVELNPDARIVNDYDLFMLAQSVDAMGEQLDAMVEQVHAEEESQLAAVFQSMSKEIEGKRQRAEETNAMVVKKMKEYIARLEVMYNCIKMEGEVTYACLRKLNELNGLKEPKAAADEQPMTRAYPFKQSNL